MIQNEIKKLVCYGLEKGLIEKRDEIYTTNMLIDALGLDTFECEENYCNVDLESTLSAILDYAVEKGIISDDITSRDLFDTKLMGLMMPRPSEVESKFFEIYKTSPEAATDYYHKLSKDSDYIRTYRIKKDIKWVSPTEYGDLDITINLSKPEKSLKEIMAAKNAPQSGYPKCLLCKECEGYAGRVNFPARQNHRIIPLRLTDEDWFMQYSPYVYYPEHCIVFNSEHTPMLVDRKAFCKLFDFVKMFPHYFIGSNAGLPIVGGSILSHEHFQGGRYTFAMEKAPIEKPIVFKGFEDVTAGIVKWPMSVIRLTADSCERVIDLADKIFTAWQGYTDESVFIYAETNGEAHNAATPIARMRGDKYELDLVLRNNITTEEHPLGVFHPHKELHHIKKENIGLIEVMGLAVLPARLKTEMAELKEAMLSGADIRAVESIEKHADWADEIKAKYADINADNIDKILQDEIGIVFSKVLEDAGVFKRDSKGQAAFIKFIDSVNA
ncbi:MAG: UDP-glucose--hexose-1-phosphate uridylyltransferase [Acutalibacteraceae bacterium]|nr:UDP-glucose--hexose-1-phosphate uridylyltransferase [Acutalibacteraceae bacterium]